MAGVRDSSLLLLPPFPANLANGGGYLVTLALIVRLRPPRLPDSLWSSTTKNFHLPLGLVSSKLERNRLSPGAGAGGELVDLVGSPEGEWVRNPLPALEGLLPHHAALEGRTPVHLACDQDRFVEQERRPLLLDDLEACSLQRPLLVVGSDPF